MSKKKTNPKVAKGRPLTPIIAPKGSLHPKEIVMDQVFMAIELMATAEEVAGSFRIHVDTLNDRLKKEYGMTYSMLLKQCSGTVKISLRRYMFSQAKNNAGMAIWLARNWLGMTDSDKNMLPPNEKMNEIAEDLIMKNFELQKEIKKLRSDIADKP